MWKAQSSCLDLKQKIQTFGSEKGGQALQLWPLSQDGSEEIQAHHLSPGDQEPTPCLSWNLQQKKTRINKSLFIITAVLLFSHAKSQSIIIILKWRHIPEWVRMVGGFRSRWCEWNTLVALAPHEKSAQKISLAIREQARGDMRGCGHFLQTGLSSWVRCVRLR